MKINFYPFSKEVGYFAPPPIPVSKALPDWYKEMTTYHKNDKNLLRTSCEMETGGGYASSATAKKCISIFDTISSGYYLLLPVDVFFDATEEEQVYFRWRMPNMEFVLRHSPEQIAGYPFYEHLHSDMLRWVPHWMFETPPGYSALVTHPMHRSDLPFITLPGIIDTDNFMPSGALPFSVKKGYKGIVKKGTPIAQVIPFKRDEWEHEIYDFVPERQQAEGYMINSTFTNGYKDTYWERKVFK